MEDEKILEETPKPKPKPKARGVQWEKVKPHQVTADEIAEALRNAGIYTAQDLQRNTRKVIGILQSLYAIDLAALLRLAKGG